MQHVTVSECEKKKQQQKRCVPYIDVNFTWPSGKRVGLVMLGLLVARVQTVVTESKTLYTYCFGWLQERI
jgi:hypothetical protein